MQDYTRLKELFTAGAIQTFDNFFDFISEKEFRQDTGIGYTHLRALRRLPGHITIEEIVNISVVTGLDPNQFGEFMIKDYLVKMQ